MPDTDGWLNTLKVPIFSMCVEGLKKIVPAGLEAEEAVRIIKEALSKKEISGEQSQNQD